MTLWCRLWQWDAVFSLHLLFGALRTVGVCDRETADGFWPSVGESGHTLTGRWKMIRSPKHIYLPNTIWVLSHVHASAQIHTNGPTCTRAQIHLSGEPQGQEVWGLIERTHDATVTLTVKVFIRGRWLFDYVTANVTENISILKKIQFVHNHIYQSHGDKSKQVTPWLLYLCCVYYVVLVHPHTT